MSESEWIAIAVVGFVMIFVVLIIITLVKRQRYGKINHPPVVSAITVQNAAGMQQYEKIFRRTKHKDGHQLFSGSIRTEHGRYRLQYEEKDGKIIAYDWKFTSAESVFLHDGMRNSTMKAKFIRSAGGH